MSKGDPYVDYPRVQQTIFVNTSQICGGPRAHDAKLLRSPKFLQSASGFLVVSVTLSIYCTGSDAISWYLKVSFVISRQLSLPHGFP